MLYILENISPLNENKYLEFSLSLIKEFSKTSSKDLENDLILRFLDAESIEYKGIIDFWINHKVESFSWRNRNKIKEKLEGNYKISHFIERLNL